MFSIVRYGAELKENEWRLLDVTIHDKQIELIVERICTHVYIPFDQEDMNRFRLMIIAKRRNKLLFVK